jgi:hypothetical protein
MLVLAAATALAATQLQVVVRTPKGEHATVTVDVNGPTLLTRYPIEVGKTFTALVSAKNDAGTVSVDVEVFRGDWRKLARVVNEHLVVTELETSFIERETTEPNGKRRWAVSAKIGDALDAPPSPDAIDRSAGGSKPSAQ